MVTQTGLKAQFNTYDQQKCFIAYTHKASWSEDILAACKEVLPRFGLEAWYADDQFEPRRSLKEKVVEMIANARYGIFDLSAMYDNERKEWVMPRNVLIELGIAIALNRPVLLLRAKENRVRGCPLPACLAGIDDIIEFSGEPTLKRALEERIPQWMNVSPDKMWWTCACLFGNRVCEYREVHPRMERWQQEGLHCHIADGPDADRVDFRETVEDEIKRYNDLTFDYLDACKPTHPYHFVQCAHCQTVRSSQFAIYRITPQTDAETYIAIGMSIALEAQFDYDIPKVFFTADACEVPSLLRGYEVIEAVNTRARKQRLRKALPVVMQRVQECAWNPRVLPFEANISIRSRVVYEDSVKETQQEVDLNTKQTYCNKGHDLYGLRRYEEALEAYEQALRLDPNFAQAYNGKGNALYNLRRYEEALEAYEQALRLDPNFAQAYNGKGNALYNLRRYEEALEAYEQALRLDPNFAQAYNNKALALDQLERSVEAQQARKKARELGLA